MSPTELRARIFATVGLPASLVALVPACGASKPPETPIVKTEADAGVSLPVAVAPSPAERLACPIDHAPEQLCGSPSPMRMQGYPFEACPRDATGLRTLVSSRTVAHGTWRGGEVIPGGGGNSFTFDADVTEAEVKEQLKGQDVERGVYKASVCCYVRCAPLEVAATPDPGPSSRLSDLCIPSPRATSVPAPRAAACPRAVRIAGVAMPFSRARDGECCYGRPAVPCNGSQWMGPDGECHHHNRGRPLREEGVVRLAPTVRRGEWSRAPETAAVRAEVAEAWSRAAAAEHSSVAAFARLSLELLALGAPPELVRDCHVAATEEVDHAARSYAIASRFAGHAMGPGPLPMTFAAPQADLARLVAETFTDGCVAETVAALEAEEARAATEDAEIRGALEVIARDEASHATFAFRLVAWALREGGAPARAALEEGVRAVETEVAGAAPCGAVHVTFGMLDAPSLAAVRLRALREVVLPCARALLAA